VEPEVVGKMSFSTRLQSIVALIAGLTSIGGAGYSALAYLRADRTPGQIVTIVRDAATARPVRGALVEVLTPANELVTAVAQDGDGVARRAVPPGAYRVRVMHPDFADVIRDVQVQPDVAAEMRVMLERQPRGSVHGVRDDDAARATREGDDVAARAVREPAPRTPQAGRRQSPGEAVDHGVAVTRRILGRLGF
jgi:Carboxypeptidase regulatory-like domain